MKSIFSIGDVSRIHGISIQALRHYHKIGLIVPKQIDPDTGYRYYTFDQFQYVGRLKYLQHLGLSLDQIKAVLAEGDPAVLKDILVSVRRKKEAELKSVLNILDDIEWIEGYYGSADCAEGKVQIRQFEERYLFCSDALPGRCIEEMDINLHQKLNSPTFGHLEYRRQFGYILDYDLLLSGKFHPHRTTIFLKELPERREGRIIILPPGRYLCYAAKILNPEFSVEPLRHHLAAHPIHKPLITIALEYEDNLREYYDARYEIQLFMDETGDENPEETRMP